MCECVADLRSVYSVARGFDGVINSRPPRLDVIAVVIGCLAILYTYAVIDVEATKRTHSRSQSVHGVWSRR